MKKNILSKFIIIGLVNLFWLMPAVCVAKSHHSGNHANSVMQSLNSSHDATILSLNSDRPPGWNRGRKRGWDNGDVPPGLAKRDDDSALGSAIRNIRSWLSK